MGCGGHTSTSLYQVLGSRDQFIFLSWFLPFFFLCVSPTPSVIGSVVCCVVSAADVHSVTSAVVVVVVIVVVVVVVFVAVEALFSVMEPEDVLADSGIFVGVEFVVTCVVASVTVNM